MKARYFILFSSFFITLICSHASAQDAIVKGVIIEKGSNIRVALAVITNKRTKLGVGSNDLGIFQIKANQGDTLLITKRNLKAQEFVIRSTQDAIIYLIRESTQLEEVTVKGNTKKEDFAEIKREYRNKGSFYQGKPPFLSFLFTPLTAFYEVFGKTPKNARRFGKYADNELKQSQIDVYFNQSIIRNNSDLTGEKLQRYMLDCRPEFEKAQYWNAYDYINYIKKSSKNFTDTLGKGK